MCECVCVCASECEVGSSSAPPIQKARRTADTDFDSFISGFALPGLGMRIRGICDSCRQEGTESKQPEHSTTSSSVRYARKREGERKRERRARERESGGMDGSICTL